MEREGNLDTLEVQVELKESMFESGEIRALQGLEKKIRKDIKDYLGVSAKVKLVEPKTLQRFEGKARRVIDKRSI